MTSIFSVVKKGFILAQSGLSESQAWSALEQAGVQKFEIDHSVLLQFVKDIVNTSTQNSTASHDGVCKPSYIVTGKGVVFGDSGCNTITHRFLSFLMKLAGLEIVYELPHPLSVSPLDYIHLNKELAFIGVTDSTSNESVRWLLDAAVFGTDRVCVVRDCFDRQAPRKHLANVFNLVSNEVAVVSEAIAGAENLKRRLVTEYKLENGRYVQTVVDMELMAYLEWAGFRVVIVPATEDSADNGLAFLHLGSQNVLIAKNQESVVATVSKLSGITLNPVTLDTTAPVASFFIPFRDSLASEPSSPNGRKEEIDGMYRPWKADRSDSRKQTTDKILTVAPIGFVSNPQTLIDNKFMKEKALDKDTVEKLALQEFSAFHLALTQAGVQVVLNCNERFFNTPDAVFPNNWFSTHVPAENPNNQSTLFLYPMKSPSRSAERRAHIINDLQARYDTTISLTHWEQHGAHGICLEGTGSLLLDRVNKVAYCLISQRADQNLFHRWCQYLGYKPVAFHAVDHKGDVIYHTNVMMAIGTSVAILCSASIVDENERKLVVESLSKHHEIVDISFEQMLSFCGNALEVRNNKGQKIMAMSTRAYKAFTSSQIDTIMKHVDKIVHVDIPTIEDIGGGGVRCMMGELY